jgi:glycosyltransferase involved in cell wall biosynthesis
MQFGFTHSRVNLLESLSQLFDYNGRMSSAIAVNARSIHHPLSGVGRYTRQVTRRLGNQVRLISSEVAAQGYQGHLWEQFILPGKLARGELLWSPANTGPLAVARQVVTIHDISPLDQPDGFKHQFRIWYRILLPLLANRSRVVITDSEFSRRRIVERLGVAPGKVEAIPLGIDQEHFYPRGVDEIAAIKQRYGLPGSYLLSVGSLEQRKNYARLFRAWERAAPLNGGTSLVVLGSSGRPFRRLQFERLPDRVQFIPYVSEPELPALYSGALALLYPSLYEGFGLPVLEAMACGIPVIASDAGALPEVVAETGQLVDPLDVEEITQAIVQISAEPALRESFAAKGLSRAGEFSWDQTAARIAAVLEGVSSEP